MKATSTLLLLVTVLCFPFHARADVTLPNIFGDHMVLQRDAALRVWGSAGAGETVSVQIDEHKASTKASANGSWLVELPALQADGQAHQMTIRGKNEIVLNDLLIGDVWIGSGQSNMEWPLKNTERAEEFIKAANHPNIRLFHIPKVQKPKPATDVKAQWKECSPTTIPNFSAVLYHFGLRLHEEIHVPIGLINSSWGGSPIEPWTVGNNDQGSGKMFNGMIAPITNFSVRGTIWYQGETNVIQKNGLRYTEKMRNLITGWRQAFSNDDMPFYFVHIAPWSGDRYEVGQLPALWEAQTATLQLPHTGMAVVTDLVDNISDIHPRNKHAVGERLARWALANNYGQQDLIYSGPIYKSMRIEGNKIRLSFAHVGPGLKSRDGTPLNEFQLAAADGSFVPAQATIDGASILVSAAAVNSPTQVRFAWHKLANPNLINAAGLPAAPFQTNHWTGHTGE